MKSLFIECKANIDINLTDSDIDRLPETVCIAGAVQFVHLLDQVKNQLESNAKQVFLFGGRHTRHPGQILGCDIKNNLPQGVEAFLYIGDGLFHPKALQFQTTLPVFVYDPFTKEMQELDRSEIEQILRKQKANYTRFLSSDKIGVIITIKPGQRNAKKAQILKKKFPDKVFYNFVCDTLDFSELENYPFIECWVNTTCPRIGLDDTNKINKAIVNMEQLGEELLF